MPDAGYVGAMEDGDTVQEISDAQVADAVARVLDEAGVDLDTLREHYQRGRFDTEKQRRAWFTVSGLLGEAVDVSSMKPELVTTDDGRQMWRVPLREEFEV